MIAFQCWTIRQQNSIFYNNPKLIWLYGIPKYPCEITELNFKKLDKFDGYSNHCQDPLAIYVARSLGAKYFEIHVTMDKSKDYIDNVVSFDFNETKLIIENIKKIKFLLNNRRDE